MRLASLRLSGAFLPAAARRSAQTLGRRPPGCRSARPEPLGGPRRTVTGVSVSADSRAARRPRLRQLLGPGLIAGGSDDDPSGIATYSQAGAEFVYGLLWTFLGGALNVSPINPIRAPSRSAVLKRVIAVPVMTAMMHLSSWAEASGGAPLPRRARRSWGGSRPARWQSRWPRWVSKALR